MTGTATSASPASSSKPPTARRSRSATASSATSSAIRRRPGRSTARSRSAPAPRSPSRRKPMPARSPGRRPCSPGAEPPEPLGESRLHLAMMPAWAGIRKWGLAVVAALAFSMALGGRAEAQSCNINSVAAGSYGTISNLLTGANVDSTSTFNVTCTGSNGSVVRLCLELARGSTPSGGAGERALLSGANFLDHELYSDAARTTVWGAWGNDISPAYSSGGVQFDLSHVGGGG